MNFSVTKFVIVTNFLLRFFIVYMTNFIRYRSLTSEVTFIKNSVFYALFFNSAIVIIFATFSFSVGSGPIGNLIYKLFPGAFINFNSYWF